MRGAAMAPHGHTKLGASQEVLIVAPKGRLHQKYLILFSPPAFQTLKAHKNTEGGCSLVVPFRCSITFVQQHTIKYSNEKQNLFPSTNTGKL